ncbi:hypothetical protein BH18ACT9_BH18ACT9_13540 [soil metagenome]
MTFTSFATTVLPSVSEAAAQEPAINPYLVGVGTFAILMAMMAALVMFGAGRDHS